ncbi:RNA polymerase sigma factor [Pseudochryseolinea flava]|uniref:RNA polymerase subunit sigma-70 n=1 Tax=Pseudochryseolinea flava TaxID=2059302 RepID=A0A364Y6R2_9BACT|nr:RNA polymerase sigma factor [Pseudochryseolinea flava]RAW01534.1 RNA polymerase subunit sigma-70 [Pseudochryseolinea flava]
MKNPFNSKAYNPQDDALLIKSCLAGSKDALNKLIEGHQSYIFNVALKYFNHIADAEDATQEVLIKVIANLGTFDSAKAQFRTWLYRITVNHFLNTKKGPLELRYESGFENFFQLIESLPVVQLQVEEELQLKWEIEESKVACMAGMIMCLDREQRLRYILGDVFEIDHNLGAEIFNISADNFRQRLSRSRKDLYAWMHNKCGLVNKDNPCRCPGKTKGFIERGYVNPKNLKWHSDFSNRIFELSERTVDNLLNERDKIYSDLFRQHPFKATRITTDKILNQILDNDNFSRAFDLK